MSYNSDDIRLGKLDGFRVNYAVGLVEMCIGAAVGVIVGNLVDGAVSRLIDRDTTYYSVTNKALDSNNQPLPFNTNQPSLFQPDGFTASDWATSSLYKQLDLLMNALNAVDDVTIDDNAKFVKALQEIITKTNKQLMETTQRSTKNGVVDVTDPTVVAELQSLVTLIQNTTALSNSVSSPQIAQISNGVTTKDAIKSKIKEIIIKNSILRASSPDNGMTITGRSPDDVIQKINICTTTPYTNPGILSFGIYTVCIGIGALVGAKNQLNK
jgi:hypothetical protein